MALRNFFTGFQSYAKALAATVFAHLVCLDNPQGIRLQHDVKADGPPGISVLQGIGAEIIKNAPKLLNIHIDGKALRNAVLYLDGKSLFLQQKNAL